MKNIASVRKEMGVRTVFNMCVSLNLMFYSLGPLINPAKPKRMILGVSSPDLGPVMAKTLHLMGVERAWVVHGLIGLDEIAPEGETAVWELDASGSITEKRISPADFGLQSHSLDSVRGGDSAQNSKTMSQLLSGQLQGPVLDFVLLNSAALLFVAGRASSLSEGVQLARESIRSGQAFKSLEAFKNSI